MTLLCQSWCKAASIIWNYKVSWPLSGRDHFTALSTDHGLLPIYMIRDFGDILLEITAKYLQSNF